VDSVEKLEGGKVTARRAIEMGYETIEVPCPAVLTAGVALLEDDPAHPAQRQGHAETQAQEDRNPAAQTRRPRRPDLAALRTTQVLKREPVPERVIQSVDVDPESESALKAMLETVLKGG
jgi:electron transfer flavoprotein alpha/beta subunit